MDWLLRRVLFQLQRIGWTCGKMIATLSQHQCLKSPLTQVMENPTPVSKTNKRKSISVCEKEDCLYTRDLRMETQALTRRHFPVNHKGDPDHTQWKWKRGSSYTKGTKAQKAWAEMNHSHSSAHSLTCKQQCHRLWKSDDNCPFLQNTNISLWNTDISCMLTTSDILLAKIRRGVSKWYTFPRGTTT